MPSYTTLADVARPDPLPPPKLLASAFTRQGPQQLDRWFLSLSPAERGRVVARVQNIVATLPPAAKKAFDARMRSRGVSPNLGDIGLGFAAIGAALTSLAQIGTSLYMGKENQDFQQDLASAQMQHSEEMQKLLLQAQKETAEAATQAQIEAAQAARDAAIEAARIQGATTVQKAQITAPVLQEAVKWGSLALAGTALLVGVAVVAKKKKRR